MLVSLGNLSPIPDSLFLTDCLFGLTVLLCCGCWYGSSHDETVLGRRFVGKSKLIYFNATLLQFSQLCISHYSLPRSGIISSPQVFLSVVENYSWKKLEILPSYLCLKIHKMRRLQGFPQLQMTAIKKPQHRKISLLYRYDLIIASILT